jgi:beta-galactosidase
MALVLRQPKKVYPRMPKRLPLIDQYPLYTLSFNGVDGYVNVPDSNSLDSIFSTNIATFKVWVMPMKTGTAQGILTKEQIYAEHVLNFESSNFFRGVFRTTGAGLVNVDSPVVALYKWYHVVSVYDGSAVLLYVNGSLVGSKPASGALASNTVPVQVGNSYYYHTRWFGGLISIARIYNRALSQAEIQYNMYNPLSPVRDGLVL